MSQNLYSFYKHYKSIFIKEIIRYRIL